MKNPGLLIALALSAGTVSAQTSGGTQTPSTAADTTHHFMHHHWAQGGQAGASGVHRGPGEFQHGPNGFAHRPGEGWAQGGRFRHPGFGGAFHVRYTPEQRRQMMAINSDYRKKQEDLYAQDNLTLGAYKAQLMALNKDKKSKLEALLTPAQKDQMAQAKKTREENAQVMAAAHLERLKIDLQLSDDQEARIKGQESDMRTKMTALRNNDDLLPDQKRAQFKALFDEHQKDLASVLTPDQQAKLKTFREHRHGSEFGRWRGPQDGSWHGHMQHPSGTPAGPGATGTSQD